MKTLLNLSRVPKINLISCGQAAHFLTKPVSVSSRNSLVCWCSTIKRTINGITPGHNASRKGSEADQGKKKNIVLSEEAQRAVWAWKIMASITEAPPKISKTHS